MYYFSKTRSCFEEIVQNIELQLEVHTNLHLPHESKAMPTWLPTCLYCTSSGSTKGKGTRSTRCVVPQDAMGVPDRQMMKKGQASMALEKRDQIERKRCHRIMMPTLPAGTLDGRAPPAHRSARPRRTQLLQESFAFPSLAGGRGRRSPARRPAPTAKQGQDASDAHYRWCAGDGGTARGGGSRPG